MVQKWDYKTVQRTSWMGEVKFYVDAQETTLPDNAAQWLKELGQEGWELVAHSAYAVPSAAQSMAGTTDALPLFDEHGAIHPLRMPSVVDWWFFKRSID